MNPYQEALEEINDSLEPMWSDGEWSNRHGTAILEALTLASELHGCRKVYGIYSKGFDVIDTYSKDDMEFHMEDTAEHKFKAVAFIHDNTKTEQG